MKIQNTLNQKELEILLRFANWAHTTFEWRFGQAIFNGLHIMFPATAEEVRYPNPLDPFHKDTVKADFYSMICPDPPKEEDEWEEHNVCAECQSIGIAYKDCVCTYMKNYPTIKLKFKKCSHCGHVDDTHLHESEINSEPLTT